MKKVILSLVFVFALSLTSFTMIDKNLNIEKNYENPILSESEIDFDCFDWAWEQGTEQGNGDPYLEWYYTEQNYNACLLVLAYYDGY